MNRPDFDTELTAALPSIERATRLYAQRYNMADEWPDVLHDVVLRLLTYSDHYDPDKGNMMQWCARMIINRLNELHNYRISKPTITDYNCEVVASVPDDTDIYSSLQFTFILANLNRESKMYFEGYNFAEIAKAVGLRGRTGARWRIDNCAKKISKILGYDQPPGRRRRVCAKC